MMVEIASRLMEQILDAATRDPAEICGLLLGGAGRIDTVLPAANVAPDPRHHFELDPVVLIAAHRAARTGGPRVMGHYHSHPSGDPVPSATDAANAVSDGTLWLIVAGRSARLWIAGAGGGGVVFTEARLVVRCDATGASGVASPDAAAH
ncbi:MAG: M67 family metallopeptidase [Sphingobium sp.]